MSDVFGFEGGRSGNSVSNVFGSQRRPSRRFTWTLYLKSLTMIVFLQLYYSSLQGSEIREAVGEGSKKSEGVTEVAAS